MVPSLLDEGSLEALCSCRGSLEPRRRLYGLWARKRRGELGKCGCPSHQRTPSALDRCDRSPCAIGSSRTRLFLQPLWTFFRLLERRPTARQTVASLTETPETAYRNSALWERVAHGRSSRSSKSSFLAFSSSFGFLPGAFLGSRVPRSSSCLQ